MGRGKNILLGITGGIAAYKIPELIRLLRKRNINVKVAMTKNAERFVTPTTLRTLSGNRVITANWDESQEIFEHLDAGKDLDLALIAPATANFIGKLASGVADDLLLTALLPLECPIYVAPSMNPKMYANPAVQDNIATLAERNIQIIQPDIGETACGDVGEGRLPEPARLIAVLEHALGMQTDLAGKKVVVTAGRTEEPIDSVRFISNRSSGKMGIAIAVAARDRGAEVVLIHGPVSEPLPEMIHNIEVRMAEEMHEEVIRHFNDCDILVMTAAVSDFKPASVFDTKIKKMREMTVALSQTPDILESLGRMKKGQLLVGFAAETENHIKNAREKMLKKNLDLICVNDVGRSDIGFDSDYNELTFITRSQEVRNTKKMPKKLLANMVLDEVVQISGLQDRKIQSKNG